MPALVLSTVWSLVFAFAPPAAAADACPYSLKRVRSNMGERLLMTAAVSGEEGKPARLEVVDVTLLLEDLGKAAPEQMKQLAFLSQATQDKLSGWACELHRDPLTFRVHHAEKVDLPKVELRETVPPLDRVSIAVKAEQGRLPEGWILVMRTHLPAGAEVTVASLSLHVAGIIWNQSFVPIDSFLPIASDEYREDIAATITALLRDTKRLERHGNGLQAGDLLSVNPR